MILLIGGTSESCDIARLLTYKKMAYTMSVATQAGIVMAETYGVSAAIKRFSLASIKKFITVQGVHTVIDASHPHAGEVSTIAMKGCEDTGVRYIRYERPTESLKSTSHLHLVSTMADAKMLAARLGEVVLVTGSKHVNEWQELKNKRLIFRVLPRTEVLKALETGGVTMDNIIAQKGPFSYAANRAVIEDFGIEVFVMKESGSASNTAEKLMAAKDAGIHCIVVQRPIMNYPLFTETIQSLFELLEGET